MTVSNIGFNNTLMEKEIKNIPPLTFQSDLISSKIYSDRAKCVFFYFLVYSLILFQKYFNYNHDRFNTCTQLAKVHNHHQPHLAISSVQGVVKNILS